MVKSDEAEGSGRRSREGSERRRGKGGGKKAKEKGSEAAPEGSGRTSWMDEEDEVEETEAGG